MTMKALLFYLKEKRGTLFCALLCIACFSLVFYLYGLPAEAVWYAALLCAVIGAAFAVHGAVRSGDKQRQIRQLQRVTDCDPEKLPPAGTGTERAYQELIGSLCASRRDLTTEYDRRGDEMAEYFTVWVHQIKTPIAAMYLLLQDEDSENSRELQCELLSMEQYVQMALGYLRLGSDSTDFVIKKCDVDRVIRQVLRKYAKLFIRKKLRLVYEGVQLTVLTDEKWLAFVLEQVLSNALKYTPSGSVSIYEESDGALCIKDTGIGISPEDLPRVFENGYTGYNGRTDKNSTGIGL